MQTLHVLWATGQPQSEAVLFLPGDGCWSGRAVEMAYSIAALGHNVYGFHTRAYRTDFTGTVTLTEKQMALDLRSLLVWLHQQSGQPLLVAGWSQGASMAVLGASASKDQPFCRGVIAIGLSDTAVLGWRLIDHLTYITRQKPNEPTFSTLAGVSAPAPMPLAIIGLTCDEYVPQETTEQLLRAAAEPKRLFRVDARNHRFDGNYQGFEQALGSSMEWIRQVNSARGDP